MRNGLMLLFILVASSAFAQKQPQVVVQFTNGDSTSQTYLTGHIRNLLKGIPDAEIEIVCHGSGVEALTQKNSKVASEIRSLTTGKVYFSACENSMARRKISKGDLLQGVKTVPSGVVEIVLKQGEGWSYLKGGI